MSIDIQDILNHVDKEVQTIAIKIDGERSRFDQDDGVKFLHFFATKIMELPPASRVEVHWFAGDNIDFQVCFSSDQLKVETTEGVGRSSRQIVKAHVGVAGTDVIVRDGIHTAHLQGDACIRFEHKTNIVPKVFQDLASQS